MPQITRLSQQKKDKERVNLYLDGKFAFGITLEQLLGKRLKVGQELSQDDITSLQNQDLVDKTYANILRFAMSRPHSLREYELWFRKKKIEGDVSVQVMQKLEKLDLVNDEKFARWWIEQRAAFRPKGKNALKAELMQKGIARETIDEVLSETGSETELEVAKQLVLKRLKRLQGLDANKQKQKLLEFLGRRGYSYDIAKQVLKDIDE